MPLSPSHACSPWTSTSNSQLYATQGRSAPYSENGSVVGTCPYSTIHSPARRCHQTSTSVTGRTAGSTARQNRAASRPTASAAEGTTDTRSRRSFTVIDSDRLGLDTCISVQYCRGCVESSLHCMCSTHTHRADFRPGCAHARQFVSTTSQESFEEMMKRPPNVAGTLRVPATLVSRGLTHRLKDRHPPHCG